MMGKKLFAICALTRDHMKLVSHCNAIVCAEAQMRDLSKSEWAHEIGGKEFMDPWLKCPNCHQEFRNELAVDIATKFAGFVRRQYPLDTQTGVELLRGIYLFESMFGRLLPWCKRGKLL